jgi:ubiquinone/menaquinone biosynthesis C-methylase UbiE
MHGIVCPWWLGPLLASPLRRLFQDPGKMLGPYVREGMTVLEPGPGMGFFTLELARRVGAQGRVVAVDVQARMLKGLRRRAVKAGLADRIDMRLAQPDSMGLDDLAGKVDLAVVIAMVHEVPSPDRLFAEIAATLKPGACLFLVEPTGHVNAEKFQAELDDAARAGLTTAERPTFRRRLAAVLQKPVSH